LIGAEFSSRTVLTSVSEPELITSPPPTPVVLFPLITLSEIVAPVQRYPMVFAAGRREMAEDLPDRPKTPG